MDFQEILQQQFLSNSLENYCWFLGFVLFGLLFKRIISKYLSHIMYRLLNKDKSIDIKTFDELLIKPIGFFILLMFVYLGSLNASFPQELNFETKNFNISLVLAKTFSIIVLFSISKIALRFVDYFGIVFLNKAKHTESKMDDQLIPFVIELGKIAVYIILFFVLLSKIFDIDVTALAAGVGIEVSQLPWHLRKFRKPTRFIYYIF